MSDAALAVALIGYGFAGRTFHAPLIAATPGLDLAVVASRDAGKVHADFPDARVLADPLQALAEPDVDLVVIASPNDSHAPLARAALEAGKHVVVDKPFTLTLGEARDLAALAHARGRRLSVFQNRRWDSDFLAVRQAIDAGLIGEVVSLETHFDRFRPEVRARWREQDVPGGGIWFDLGPHLIDQSLQLFGLPRRVSADFAIQRPGGHSADWAHVVLDYGQRRAILHASMLSAGGSHRFLAHGTRGSLVKRELDPQEAQLLGGMRPGAPGWGEDPDRLLLFDGGPAPRSLPAPAGDQRRYYAGMREAILGGSEPPVTPGQAVATMAVLETALHAAREGAALELPLTAEERAAWGA
ncbi:oxidoreductase [Luteimonas aquatica]|uniref:oxidoreductase n=1 Tax=Luteimonas aquatica TaxID=450364 RepID=UPI001F56F6D6|nr:oxidoreductase [Luteimonas aquatica]